MNNVSMNMKNYTIIPKKIIEYKSNSKPLDIYTFACIKTAMNYGTRISEITQKKIFDNFDIPQRTFRESIKRLEEQMLLTFKSERRKNKNPKINLDTVIRNSYKFDKIFENYFFVYNDFLRANIPKEIKGFLLILKAVCFNCTNAYMSNKPIKGSINKSELSKLINMDIKTINKYLKMAKDLNEIAIIDSNIIVLNNNFPLRIKNGKNNLDDRKTEIANTILEVCNKYNVITPVLSESELKMILLYYPYKESEIELIHDVNIQNKCSLKNILDKRLKTSPIRFNTEYLLQVLNIPKPDKKERIKYEFKL